MYVPAGRADSGANLTLNTIILILVGGAFGAMLGLAKNQLSSTDYSQLGKSVPGLDKLSGSNSLGSLGALSEPSRTASWWA